mmetsp:Transcript_25825/g.39691  ORF Transcript_25825/g.39691 Transcript_25825/m.39691 type:complete len:103 (+) Transcript_25825:1101-1409(+)
MVHPSQLEEKFGGTSPNLTRYWPPVVPELPSGVEPPEAVSRENYKELYLEHPQLCKMPKRFREDLGPLPGDDEDEIRLKFLANKDFEQKPLVQTHKHTNIPE